MHVTVRRLVTVRLTADEWMLYDTIDGAPVEHRDAVADILNAYASALLSNHDERDRATASWRATAHLYGAYGADDTVSLDQFDLVADKVYGLPVRPDPPLTGREVADAVRAAGSGR